MQNSFFVFVYCLLKINHEKIENVELFLFGKLHASEFYV